LAGIWQRADDLGSELPSDRGNGVCECGDTWGWEDTPRISQL